MTNGSDFSRYAKNAKSYYFGSFFSLWVVGILVCFVGLVTTAAAQLIYGQVYWNRKSQRFSPMRLPDLKCNDVNATDST
jgi:cytosine/uracil/thiamine/allantoin permease